MIDPSLSLAISVQSNPGVFALLLGSGVSRSAGMPTEFRMGKRQPMLEYWNVTK